MYRWVDHTAELELELEAPTPEGVLEEATRAFAELVADEGDDGEVVERDVSVSAPDLPALLQAWIDELVFLADTESIVPSSADVRLDEGRLIGVLHARRGSPRPVVKAVTFHRLAFAPDDGIWRGRVVLDV